MSIMAAMPELHLLETSNLKPSTLGTGQVQINVCSFRMGKMSDVKVERVTGVREFQDNSIVEGPV
jgi:hypothetical protein